MLVWQELLSYLTSRPGRQEPRELDEYKEIRP